MGRKMSQSLLLLSGSKLSIWCKQTQRRAFLMRWHCYSSQVVSIRGLSLFQSYRVIITSRVNMWERETVLQRKGSKDTDVCCVVYHNVCCQINYVKTVSNKTILAHCSFSFLILALHREESTGQRINRATQAQ